jgi:hypothetical protein
MGNEIDQDIVEQADMIGPEMGGPDQEQLGDALRRPGSPPRIAAPDDFVKPGDERCGRRHQINSKRAGMAIGGNLGRHGEGRVRFGHRCRHDVYSWPRASRVLPVNRKTAISPATSGSHTIAY